jgi:hypothetical protein
MEKNKMNLLEQFENEDEQNVETFNKLFPMCKITGSENETPVTIGPMFSMGRKIIVGKDWMYVKLPVTISERKAASLFIEKPAREFKERNTEKPREITIPEEFSLSDRSFKVLQLLRFNGYADNLTNLAKLLKTSKKTLRNSIEELSRMRYIKIETIGNFSRITLAENTKQ